MKKKPETIKYEAEADVLSWEINDKPIDYAKEVGNVVVHFTKHNIPVLVEVLEATKFIKKAKVLIEETRGISNLKRPVAI